MMRATMALALLAAGLAGCGGGGGAGGARPKPVSAAPAPRSTIVVVPQVMAPVGLEGVIGTTAPALLRRFGSPRIDLAEGDARKLQFSDGTCVLDIFLYPVSAGAEPTATHIEARLRAGGAPVDKGACIRAFGHK
jgi:hypothetical protein